MSTEQPRLSELLELTGIPTASGREDRVVAWVERWAAERGVAVERDRAGNLTLRHPALPEGEGPPVLFTAHMDHPAFVVERIVAPGVVQVAFRGGVMDDYFAGASVAVHASGGAVHRGAISGPPQVGCAIFKSWLAELSAGDEGIRVGDVATWDLPAPEVRDGLLHAPACDDLAGAAAALAAFDDLLQRRGEGERVADVRVLLTRAEEVGFLGAIAACREGTIPRGARVIALENSRSFDDSPIGGGPIVRVGDRLSIFSPSLTGACAEAAERMAGRPAQPLATQKAPAQGRPWQRKLMAGGACEASVYCAAGFEATCLCLPLGNYHNMADLAAVQARAFSGTPRIAPEFISVADYEGLVALLVECGRNLPAAPDVSGKIAKLWEERSFVLGA